MPLFARRWTFLPCLALLLALGGEALAQQAEQAFGFQLTEWNQVITEVERAAEAPELPPSEVAALRDRLFGLKQQIEAARDKIKKPLDDLRVQIDALGPAPAEGEPPEALDLAAKRQSLTEQITRFTSRIKEAELLLARIADLDSEIAARARESRIERLLQPFPSPFSPATMGVAVPDFFHQIGTLARAPGNWWVEVGTPEIRRHVLERLAIVVALALAFGLLLRRLLLSKFGRDPSIAQPSYSRRLAGAVAEGLANGLIPALLFGGLLYRATERRDWAPGLFGDMVIGFFGVMMLFFVTRAFVRAALAPELPAWQLEDIRPKVARRLRRLIMLLAGVFALDIFLIYVSRSLDPTIELNSVVQFAFNLLEAGLVIALMRPGLWRSKAAEEAEAAEGEGEEEAESSLSTTTQRFWRSLRIVVILVASASIVAAALGYANLAQYLINNLVISGLIVGGLYLLRGLFRELIGVTLRSDFVQKKLGVRHRTRGLLKFWGRGLLDVVALLAGFVLVLPGWGVPLHDILRWSGEILQGFTIGNVTISPTDVIAGVIVFTIAIVLTRMLQRLLSDRVLPATSLDSGVRNSIASGVGYVGVIIAAAIGISTIGLDLSNLALVAGALSVGIGFGLQTVVNNFVSGLILLVERPVKVGDWVIVGGHEGYVKRINVRATEIETFQRASVIIPNSELVSSSVVNWTHKNKLGRVEVPVGVAYGSDVDKVIEVLMDCLRADQRIMKWPEPFVLFRGFGDSSLDFEARGYIFDVEYVVRIGSDLRIAINRAFKENGIEIPFPQRDLHLKDIDRLAAAIEARGGLREEQEEPCGPARAEEAAVAPPRERRGKPVLAEIGSEGSAGEGDR